MTDEKRGAAARKARHLNALRRKAPAMVEALRELGYTVTAPQPSFTGIPEDNAADYDEDPARTWVVRP